MVKSGCKAYLAHVIDTRIINNTIENILVLNEFLDVFSDNLLGLPPDREVKFIIEQVLLATPISISPYRMVPVELKELKTRL